MMMGVMPNAGVQIRLADGGYIIQWMEPRKPLHESGDSPSYLEQERHALGGCLPGQSIGPMGPMATFKCAVRVRLEDALKLTGEILDRLKKAGVEDDQIDSPDLIA